MEVLGVTLKYLIRVDLIGELHNQLTQTSFHFSTKGEMSTRTPHEIVGALMPHFNTNVAQPLRECLSTQWHLKTLLAYTMLPKSDVLFEIAYPVGAGGEGDDSLPSHNAVLLRLRTGFGGRSRSGSLHLPGVPDSAVKDSRLQGTILTELRDASSIILAAYGLDSATSGFVYGIYSRKLGDVRDPGPPVSITHRLEGFTPVNEIVVEDVVGTINKRRLGRGV